MRVCVICKTRYQKESGITFHKFPTEPRLKLWLKSIKIENWRPKQNDHICSKHFTDDCFIGHEKRTTLKKCGIPTIFSGGTSTTASCTTSTDKSDPVINQEPMDCDTSRPREYVALPKLESLGASAICINKGDTEVDLEAMEGSTLLPSEYMELSEIESLGRDSSFYVDILIFVVFLLLWNGC